MTQKIGIDVSHHQGAIDWYKVKGNVDFAILRAGYGQNAIDNYFHRNAKECAKVGIPFGAYWFSYAYTVDMAQREAKYFIEVCKDYKLDYPLAYDFEYDSYNYAFKNGVKVTADLMAEMADAFLTEIENAGYYAINYSNPDFINRGFYKLIKKYDLWLAHWGEKSPSERCGIWQYTSSSNIPGIKGEVDSNISYRDYPALINGMRNISAISPFKESTKETLEDIHKTFNKVYVKIAQDIILGKYGNGEERKRKLTAAGYDYIYAQTLVNGML